MRFSNKIKFQKSPSTSFTDKPSKAISFPFNDNLWLSLDSIKTFIFRLIELFLRLNHRTSPRNPSPFQLTSTLKAKTRRSDRKEILIVTSFASTDAFSCVAFFPPKIRKLRLCSPEPFNFTYLSSNHSLARCCLW
jgi:hypothetical protein